MASSKEVIQIELERTPREVAWNGEENGRKVRSFHGAKGDKEKIYHRRAKNKPLREIKKIIKKG